MFSVDAFLVNAFAERSFTGCPAAICALSEWPSDEILQSVTNEFNQSETAFFVPQNNSFELRWFTTTLGEIDLCGHATMAAAHVIFEHLGYKESEVSFQTRFSGILKVRQDHPWLILDLPAWPPEKLSYIPDLAVLGCGGIVPKECYARREYLLVYENEDIIREMKPDFRILSQLDRWVSVTASGRETDFVSRFFCPGEPLEEDPVTGSAHSMLVPFWATRLRKNKLSARQLSKRGGSLLCELAGDRVLLSGKAKTFLQGKIFLEI